MLTSVPSSLASVLSKMLTTPLYRYICAQAGDAASRDNLDQALGKVFQFVNVVQALLGLMNSRFEPFQT